MPVIVDSEPHVYYNDIVMTLCVPLDSKNAVTSSMPVFSPGSATAHSPLSMSLTNIRIPVHAGRRGQGAGNRAQGVARR